MNIAFLYIIVWFCFLTPSLQAESQTCSNDKESNDDLSVMISLDETRLYIDVPLVTQPSLLSFAAENWCASNLEPSTVQGCTQMISSSLSAQQSARFDNADPVVQTIKRNPIPNLVVIDDFLVDPDQVREFALTQDFKNKKENEQYNPLQVSCDAVY